MPAKNQKLRRYVIMSNEGFLGPSLTAATFKPSASMVAVRARREAVTPAPQMRVLDALHENGPKLVEMSAEGELSLRLSMPGVKIVPEVFYHRQWQRFRIHRKPASNKPAARRSTTGKVGKMKVAKAPVAVAAFDVTVTGANGSAIKGAQIVAFTNFATREGASATTGTNGRATLKDISPGRKLERVYVYPKADHWGLYATDTTGSKALPDQAESDQPAGPVAFSDPALRLIAAHCGRWRHRRDYRQWGRWRASRFAERDRRAQLRRR